MDGNQLAARFIRDLKWEALPHEVQRKSKLCLLDALGALISGTITPISKITSNYAAQAWKGDEATIILHSNKATAAGAALANGYAANGFDSDDGANFTKGHPGAQLIPTALAVSEKYASSGKEMLTAIVVGYEIAIRTGYCWHDYHNDWQACGSWGSVANSAATAHLMGLNEEQIWNALGIAEYFAPNLPMYRDIDHPAMVKHGIGWGAMTGITAAELAAHGFTGIPSILGFKKYWDFVSDLGEKYHMPDQVWFKEFASCGFGHTAVLAAREILETSTIRADQIKHIRVETYQDSVRLGSKLPKNTEEAQFNTAWPLAAYIWEREIGPRQMRDERLGDEKIVSLAKNIELVESEKYSGWARLKLATDPRGKFVTRVVITMDDGTQFDSGEAESNRYEDSRIWDEDRLARKFSWLVQDVLTTTQTQSLIDMVWDFDQLPDVHRLTAIIQ